MFYTLNHSVNFENCDVMMSISTQCRVHFCINLLSHELLGYETCLTNSYSHGQYF